MFNPKDCPLLPPFGGGPAGVVDKKENPGLLVAGVVLPG